MIAQKLLTHYGDDPQRWTKGIAARDKDGERCLPTSKEAVCWCLLGALETLGLSPEEQRMFTSGWDSRIAIAQWNDHEKRTFKEVKKRLEEMVKLADVAE